MPVPSTPPFPPSGPEGALDRIVGRVRSGTLRPPGPDPGAAGSRTASVAFLTKQAAQHPGRRSGYVNAVLSVRVGAAVGSCAVEPGELADDLVNEIIGCEADALLDHPVRAVRVAVLDALLAHLVPHGSHPRARSVRISAGTSLEKSMARARAVAGLVRVPAGGRVAVLGVVNSLLVALRERDIEYLPCDFKGGRTEWGEAVLADHQEALAGCEAVVASGMVLGNGTFDDIAARCRGRSLPLSVFAQTGSAIFRELVGEEVAALSAEPYPFFWLTGDDTVIHHYAAGNRCSGGPA